MREPRPFGIAAFFSLSLVLAGCGGGGGGSGGGGNTPREPFALTGTTQAFAGVQGAASAQRTSAAPLTVTGSNVSWQATATVPWIQLAATSGSTAATIPFTVSPQTLPAGEATGIIRVTDSVSARTEEATVTVSVRRPELTVTPAALTFNVDAETTSVNQLLTISDELSGQNPQLAYTWNLSSRSPLVQLSRGNGTTATVGALTVSLNTQLLAGTLLDEGSTKLDLIANGPGSVTRVIDVAVNVRLPRANAVDPNIVAPGPATVTLMGRDFQPEDIPRLRLNGQPPLSALRLSDREIEVVLGLVGGNQVFTFANSLGLNRSLAELAVAQRGTIGAGEIVSRGPRQRLLLDSHRGVLYASNNDADTVQRFSWNGSAWQELSAVSVDDVQDIDFAANARQLYAVNRAAFYLVDRTVPTPTAELFLTAATGCFGLGGGFDIVTAPPTGTLHGYLGPNGCRLAGDSNPFFYGQYDLVARTLLFRPYPSTNEVGFIDTRPSRVSGDRRYVATTSELWDARTGTFAYTEIQGNPTVSDSKAGPDISLDWQGTKVLLAGTFIINRSGTVLCTLPANNVAVLSSDGARAYAYTHVNGGGGEIRIFNAAASGAPGSPAQCTSAASSIAVPQDIGNTPGPILDPRHVPGRLFAMTVAADDSILFLSGSARILAIDPP